MPTLVFSTPTPRHMHVDNLMARIRGRQDGHTTEIAFDSELLLGLSGKYSLAVLLIMPEVKGTTWKSLRGWPSTGRSHDSSRSSPFRRSKANMPHWREAHLKFLLLSSQVVEMPYT